MQALRSRPTLRRGGVVYLCTEDISPCPVQPRKNFDEESLRELSESIKSYGVLNPLTVRVRGGKYELVAGERRLRAAQMAGLTEIPCIVMRMDDKESGLAAMLENLQRQDLDFIEEADGIARLMSEWSMSQEQVARLLGKSQSAIANKLRILRHSQPVLNALRQFELTERHARALLKIPTEPEKMAAIAVISRLGMSVARTEKYIEDLLAEKNGKSPKVNVSSFLSNLHQSLQRIQLSGISAISERRETDSQIVLTITIPK